MLTTRQTFLQTIRDRLETHLERGEPLVWQPLEGKPQHDAYHSEADVLGYGGAAGGGKTDLLLGLAMTAHRKAKIFRRHYADLTDVVKRGDAIQDGRCTFVWGNKREWHTPDNRLIEVGAVQHEKDLIKYKGRPADFIGIDEAVDFPQSFIQFLMGWLRTTDTEQRTRVVMCFNPPTTPEGEWIINYFAAWLDDSHPNPAQPGELRWYVRLDDADVEVPDNNPVEHRGEWITPKSRTFIPARVEDNPYLMATDYPTQLNSLPEPLRSQLRWGDFSIHAKDNEWQCIPTQWVLDAMERGRNQVRPDVSLRCIGVDPSRGGDDETAIAKLYGAWFDLLTYPGASVPDGVTGAKLVTDAMETNAPVYVDAIGIGASVYDHLKPLEGFQTTAVNVGAGSNTVDKSGRYHFFNLRSQLIWQFREALDPASGHDIALPDSRTLRVDLCAPRYSIVSGKIKVESKPDIKKRIGRSTNEGDAIMLAWYGAKQPAFTIEFV